MCKMVEARGRIPANFPPEKGTGSSSSTNLMNGAGGDNGHENSGIAKDMEIINKSYGRGVDRGENLAHDKTDMSGINLNIGGKETLDLAESNGLLFL